MDTNVYFIHQIKHNKTTGLWDKGIVVKSDANTNNREAALQAYHSYLGYGMEIIKECWKEGTESNT